MKKSQSRPSEPHVLLVTPGFPEDERDSLCIPPVQLMLQELVSRQPTLHLSVLALHYPTERRRYRWHGLEVQAIGAANRRWPLRLFHLVRAWRAAATLGAGHAFTHVHAFWLTDAAATAWWIARGAGCPLSLTAMGQDVLSGNPYLRRLAQTAASIVTISDRGADAFEDFTGCRPDAVIPWGIDAPAADPPAWQDRPINLLGVGSLIELKQWSLLLETLKSLIAAGAPHRTLLVGDGPLRATLEAEARKHGLTDVLTFTGTLPRPEVLRLMEQAQVLVHPARFEGQGYVFGEALSRGMSIVSGPVGAARPSERWRVVEPQDFVAACRDLFNEPPSTLPQIDHPLDDTVDAYAQLWGLL